MHSASNYTLFTRQFLIIYKNWGGASVRIFRKIALLLIDYYWRTVDNSSFHSNHFIASMHLHTLHSKSNRFNESVEFSDQIIYLLWMRRWFLTGIAWFFIKILHGLNEPDIANTSTALTQLVGSIWKCVRRKFRYECGIRSVVSNRVVK